jgi:hypothetical protein
MEECDKAQENAKRTDGRIEKRGQVPGVEPGCPMPSHARLVLAAMSVFQESRAGSKQGCEQDPFDRSR